MIHKDSRMEKDKRMRRKEKEKRKKGGKVSTANPQHGDAQCNVCMYIHRIFES